MPKKTASSPAQSVSQKNRRDPRVDAYIDESPPAVRSVLRKIRALVRKAAPQATETFSYRMPALRGRGMLLYYAAFKQHIGLFPPVRGDASLDEALARYRGPKGNLRFPLGEPLPERLLIRIARLRVKQDQAPRKSVTLKKTAPSVGSA